TPGERILGAQPGTDEPIRKQGTSCAAPVLTGIGALLMSLQRQRGMALDAEAVRAALLKSVLPCDPRQVPEPERCLAGKLNLPGAVRLLTGEDLPVAARAPGSASVGAASGAPVRASLHSPSDLIGAIGSLGYDFGTEARRDSFK